MIEVTSRHMKCTHINSDYSRMHAVALQYHLLIFQKMRKKLKCDYKKAK